MTSKNHIFQLNACKLIDLVKSGEISITEMIESHLKRINQINPVLNAIVNHSPKQSLDTAKILDCEKKDGKDIGPLYGIPVGIKDIFNTYDFPTEMGSHLWKNFESGNDARIVSNIRLGNGIILGKTETAEFAVHALGKSKNPYDFSRSPGTSSSGSAIAVATGMSPITIGTQTAGSIIRPASYCGVYGFKPSYGLIPRTGMLKTTDTLDQIGFFGRNPYDLGLFLDVVRVKGKNYPYVEKKFNQKYLNSFKSRKLRIRFVRTHVWDSATNEVQKRILQFVDKINSSGMYDIKEVELPEIFSNAHKVHETIYAKSLAYYFKNELEKKSLVSDVFYKLTKKAESVSIPKFNDALEYQVKLRHILDNEFDNFDLIISLSTADYAPLRDIEEKPDPSLIWTMCGNPAINVPITDSTNNLPLGIQIIGKRYDDELLLNCVKSLYDSEMISESKVYTPKTSM